MWNESIRHFAEHGKGNTIFLDGSAENMQRTLQQLVSISKGSTLHTNKEDK
jgi:hypothetical protein